jgi:hypothetical protein
VARRDPQGILRQYELGNLTQHAALWDLIEVAAVTSAEEVATHLTAEWLLALRQETASPPATFEQTPQRYHAGGFLGPAASYEDERNNDRRLRFEGLWRWHRYFAGQGG